MKVKSIARLQYTTFDLTRAMSTADTQTRLVTRTAVCNQVVHGGKWAVVSLAVRPVRWRNVVLLGRAAVRRSDGASRVEKSSQTRTTGRLSSIVSKIGGRWSSTGCHRQSVVLDVVQWSGAGSTAETAQVPVAIQRVNTWQAGGSSALVLFGQLHLVIKGSGFVQRLGAASARGWLGS